MPDWFDEQAPTTAVNNGDWFDMVAPTKVKPTKPTASDLVIPTKVNTPALPNTPKDFWQTINDFAETTGKRARDFSDLMSFGNPVAPVKRSLLKINKAPEIVQAGLLPITDLAPAGPVRSVAKVAEGLTSPLNMAMLGTGIVVPAGIGRAIAGGFGLMAGHGAYTAGKELIKSENLTQASEAVTDMLLNAAFAGLAGRHAIKGTPVPPTSKLKGTATPESVKGLDDWVTVKGTSTEPVIPSDPYMSAEMHAAILQAERRKADAAAVKANQTPPEDFAAEWVLPREQARLEQSMAAKPVDPTRVPPVEPPDQSKNQVLRSRYQFMDEPERFMPSMEIEDVFGLRPKAQDTTAFDKAVKEGTKPKLVPKIPSLDEASQMGLPGEKTRGAKSGSLNMDPNQPSFLTESPILTKSGKTTTGKSAMPKPRKSYEQWLAEQPPPGKPGGERVTQVPADPAAAIKPKSGFNFGELKDHPEKGGALTEAGGLQTLYEKVRDKFKGIETPAGATLTPAQQASIDHAARRDMARQGQSALTPPNQPPTASSKERFLGKVSRGWLKTKTALDDALAPVSDTHKAAIKAGYKQDPNEHIDLRIDQVIQSRARSGEYMRPLLDEVRKLSDRGFSEASDYISAPHLKDVEIRHAGRAVYEDALKKSTHPEHTTVTKLDDAITEARKQGIQADIDKAILDQDMWVRAQGQDYWNGLINKGGVGAKTGLKAIDVEALINDRDFANTYGEIKTKFRDIVRGLEDKMVEDHIVSPEFMQKLRDIYPDYIRINRILADEADSPFASFSAATGHIASSKAVAKIKGSDAPIENVFHSVYDRANQVFNETARNRVGLTIKGYLDANAPVWKDIARVVPQKDITSKKFTPSEKNSIAYLDNGKPRYIQFDDPMIAESLRGMEPAQISAIANVIALMPARMLRGMATGFNLEFAAPNIVRDIQHTAFTSNALKETHSPSTFATAFWQALRGRGADRSEMIKQGSGFTLTDQLRAPSEFKSVTGKLITKPGELFRTFENQISKTEEMGRLRVFVGTKKQSMKPNGAAGTLADNYGIPDVMVKAGLTDAQASAIAAMEANNALPAYHRSGALIKHIGPFVPYLNAGIKATTSTLSRFKDAPMKRAATFALTLGVPTAAYVAWNLQDPRMARAWFDIAEFDKDRAMSLLPVPHDGESYEQYSERIQTKDGKYKTINLPLVQGPYRAAQNIIRRGMEEWYRKDAKGFEKRMAGLFSSYRQSPEDAELEPIEQKPLTGKEAATRAASSVIPFDIQQDNVALSTLAAVAPVVPRLMAEVGTDTKFYGNRPIVGRHMSEQGIPEVQGSSRPQTSKTATKIASAITNMGMDVAPQQVEHVATLGGTAGGKHLLYGMDVISGVPAEERGGRNPITGVADVFTTQTGGEQSRITRDTTAADNKTATKSMVKADKDYIANYAYLEKSGYKPAVSKPVVLKDDDDNVYYTESPEEHNLRLELRGLMIGQAIDRVRAAIPDAQWFKKLTRNDRQEVLKDEVRSIDSELHDMYKALDGTDDMRKANIEALRQLVNEFKRQDKETKP